MEKEKFEKLFDQYIHDGFGKFDIELKDGRVIPFNDEKNSYIFNNGYVWIGGNGLMITIDYRIINSISI